MDKRLEVVYGQIFHLANNVTEVINVCTAQQMLLDKQQEIIDKHQKALEILIDRVQELESQK